jgi:hypothetical protein
MKRKNTYRPNCKVVVAVICLLTFGYLTTPKPEVATNEPVKTLCWGIQAAPASRRPTQRQVVSNLTESECKNWHEDQMKENYKKGFGAMTVDPPNKAVTVCWEPCPSWVFDAPSW